MLNLIVAATRDFGIGFNNQLPWNYRSELARFREITCHNPHSAVQNTLIMGRLTAESLPKPLPNRVNILLTRQVDYRREGFVVKPDLLSALEMIFRENPLTEIFVIGGAQIYLETLNYPNLIRQIYLTQIEKDYECDVKIPELGQYLNDHCRLVESKSGEYSCLTYVPIRDTQVNSEQNYLDLLLKLCRAPSRRTRNAVTKSLFSTQLSFDLQTGFPLLTTKRVFWKGIVNELLFFLGGCTDNQWLKDRGVQIWTPNTSQEFIQKVGLPYQENDLGAMYGMQFRYYGAEYRGKDVDYTGQGKDQFAEVISLLLEDPFSRRILMTSYNYDQVKMGVLYPCFLENTPVLTINGYKPIQEITTSDRVLTHTGQFQVVQNLQRTFYPKGKKIYTIKTWSSLDDIKCTPEHPFYTRKGINLSEPKWVNAEDLTLDDFVGMPINQNSIIPNFTFVDHDQFLVLLDKPEQYLLMGYLLGVDDWLVFNQNEIFSFGVCLRDEEFVMDLLNKLNIKHDEVSNWITVDKTIRCYDYLFCHILKQFGQNKLIPEWLHDAPLDLIQLFIDGYERRFETTTTSMNLALSLQRLYLKLGKIVSVTNSDIKHPDNYLLTMQNVNNHFYFQNDYIWYKIGSINQYKTTEDITVYNFEVSNDNSYCVNNLIVHNCHSLVVQFYVEEQMINDQMVRTVSLQNYQRSVDYAIGLPFNIASNALLLHIVVNILNQQSETIYQVGKIHIVFGDTHLYDIHLNGALSQLSRIPRRFPKLLIKNKIESIEPKYFLQLDYKDFEIIEYDPYPSIKLEMVA
jgi:dihydrofolate reductase/thymidylate synthase